MNVFSLSSEKKLVAFLRLILKTIPLVENYYQSWSYTKTTGRKVFLIFRNEFVCLFEKGFNDALHSLDRLTSIDFHLPTNISIRRFMNNKDLIE